jgi:tripartite-type tricarboxylate transporter receptor subunit TctC
MGKEPSGPEKEAWLSFFYIGIMNSKQLVLPAGTPAEIVAAYDKAAKAMVEDPEFQQAAMAEIGKYPQLTGEQARASMAKAQTMNPETRAWIANWLKKEYNTDL